MAKVTLNVEVRQEQLDRLENRVNALDGKKITLDFSGFNSGTKEASRATQDLEKAEQAALKTEQERAKVIKEQANAETARNRTVKEGYNAVTAKERSEQAQMRTEREAIKLTREKARADEEAAKKTKEHSLAQEILGRSVGSFLARMTAYRAVYGVINTITSSFKEAIQTLKDVDDELVTVRKVTGFDAYQMADVEAQAYSVASRYGSTASDYVAGVAEFARAGYKDLSGDLAELSTKAQIVGDTTAETANQFLLSVDAAYKYKGSVTELNRVLDGANELDNKYATSIEKIAEGMGIVAPVAAQMHVGVDELAASIGTITAVTQRSGTETARALRALFLNIVGDTKTEIDEGVTWTTGEIEGLRDVIKVYAKDAYDAAQATGSIIDPMKAMEGLSKSLKDGVLSEQQLMQMVSDIGGKLRTSQLLALINNWDMYESMLNDYRNAAGSADKEIENAMDSWTRKSNVLKNTWTEFVKTGLDSGQMKGLLDFITGIVERLDSLPAVLTRILAVVASLNISKLVSGIESLYEKTTGLFASIKAGAGSIGAFGAVLGGIALAWSAVSFAVESYNLAQEKAREATENAIQAAKDDIASLDNLRSQYEAIVSSTEAESEKNKQLAEYKKQLVEVYGFEKDAVAGVNLERQTGIDLLDKEAEATLRKTLSENQATFERAAAAYNGTTSTRTFGGNIASSMIPAEELKRAGASIQELEDGTATLIVAGKNLRDTYENLGNVMAVLEKKQLSRAGLNLSEKNLLENLRAEYNRLGGEMEKWGGIYEGQIEMQARYNLLLEGTSSVIVDSRAAFDGLKRTLHETYGSNKELWDVMERMVNEMFPEYASGLKSTETAAEDATGALEDETDALFANQKALGDNASAADIAAAAQKDAEAAVRSVIPALFDEQGQLNATGQTALSASSALADVVNAQLKLQYETANSNLINLRAQLAGVSTEAIRAAMAIAVAYDAANAARAMGHSVGNLGYDRSSAANGVGTAYSLLRQIQAAEAEINRVQTQINSVQRYSSGGSSYTPSYNPHSGSSSGSGRTSGSSSSGSSAKQTDPRLESLLARVDILKAELALMKERGDSEEKQIGKMRELEGALKNLSNYYTKIGADQTDILNTEREWWSIENDIQKLLKDNTDYDKLRLEAAQNRVSLLKSELALLKEKGASDADQISKMREIMQAIHDEAELLREIGGSQEEINGLSREWWSYHNDIADMLRDETDYDKLKRDAASSRVALLKSELALMQERGDSTEAQIAKMREIIKALHDEAEVLRSIGADQEEINGYSREWWSYHNQIQELMDKEAQDAQTLADNLRDAAEAQRDLNNAERERNVHVYNKQTGQWEWNAKPDSVISAQDALWQAIQKLPEDQRAPYIAALNTSIWNNNLPGSMGLLGNMLTDGRTISAWDMARRAAQNIVERQYVFGSVTLSERQAKEYTVYEFAELSKQLSMFGNTP